MESDGLGFAIESNKTNRFSASESSNNSELGGVRNDRSLLAAN